MSSIQERLQLKRVPLDTWNIREQLCLASAVVRSGDQNWMSVSRALKTVGDPNRPADWYSQKSCAAQYGALLEHVDTPKRKKRNSEGAGETPQESILNRLTQERIAEIHKSVAELTQHYQTTVNEIAEVRNPNTSEERIRSLWSGIENAMRVRERETARRAAWLREREERRQRALRPELKQESPSSSGAPSSPLLTSLLKSSPVVTTPQHISHPANVIDAISPSAGAPTLSQLLEKTTTSQQSPTVSSQPSPTITIQSPSIINPPTSVSSQPSIVSHDNKHAAIEHIKSQLQQIEHQLNACPSTPSSGPLPPVEAPPPTDIDIDDIEIKAEDVYAFRDVDIEIRPVAHMHKTHTQKVVEKPMFLKKEEAEISTAEPEPPTMDKIEDVNQPIEDNCPAEDIINIESTTLEGTELEAQEFSVPEPQPELVPPEPEVNLAFPEVKFPTPEIKVIQPEEQKSKKEEVELESHPEEVMQPEEIVEAPPSVEENVTIAGMEEPEPIPEYPEEQVEPTESVPETTEPEIVESIPEPEQIEQIPVKDEEILEVAVEKQEESRTLIPVQQTPPPVQQTPPTELPPTTEESQTEVVPSVTEPEELKNVHDTPPTTELEDKDEDKSLEEIKKEVELEESLPLKEMKEELEARNKEEKEIDDAHTETDDDTPMELVREEEKDGKKKRDYSRKKKPDSRTCSGSESADASAPDSPTVSDAERQHRLWKRSVMLVYSRLAAHKYASLFLRPITDGEAPGYSVVVKRPMDLTTIKRNIDNGLIRTTAEFQRDVLLMLTNALMYNSSDHRVYQMTKEMFHEAENQLDMLVAAQAHAGLSAPPRRRRYHDADAAASAGTPPLGKRRHD